MGGLLLVFETNFLQELFFPFLFHKDGRTEKGVACSEFADAIFRAAVVALV
jgi:hypothetical protein